MFFSHIIHRFWLILICVLLIQINPVLAYEITDSLQVNGFGTIGLTANDSDDWQYRSYLDQEGSTEKSELDFAINTIVGLQGSYQFSDDLSLTAQGIVRYIDSDSWDTELEWAYLNYDTPWDISLRAGKFRFPIFHGNELAYVGYARTYARPPITFYGVGGYDHLLGVQANYFTTVQDYNLEVRASYGQADEDLPPRPDGNYAEIETNNIKILSAKVGNEHFWFNLAYTHLTTDLTDIPRNRPPNFRGQADLKMLSAEWQVRLAGFIHEGGYGKAKVNKFMPDEEVAYLSLSYPIDNFTPYLLYSRKQFMDLPPPPPMAPITGLSESDTLDRSYSLGVRYDIQTGLAIKLQWDYFRTAKEDRNSLSHNINNEKGSHNAVSLTLDWMF